jgi:hypothetical protein
MEGERYILAVVNTVDSMAANLAIVKWDVTTGAVVQYIDFGPSDCKLEITVLNVQTVAVRKLGKFQGSNNGNLSPIKIYSLGVSNEGEEPGKSAEDGAIEIPCKDWDFRPYTLTEEGLIFICKGLLYSYCHKGQKLEEQARVDKIRKKAAKVSAISYVKGRLTLVFEDGGFEVLKEQETNGRVTSKGIFGMFKK